MSCSLTDSQKGLNYILKTQGYVSYLKWKTDGEFVQNFVLQESMGVDSNKKDVSSEKKVTNGSANSKYNECSTSLDKYIEVILIFFSYLSIFILYINLTCTVCCLVNQVM